MIENWWRTVERDPIHARAAEWVLRLEDPQVSLEETVQWQQWMQADERHAQAFTRMEETAKALLKISRSETASTLRTLAPRRGERPRRIRIALAASVAVAVAATGAAWHFVHLPQDMVRTAVGENRSLRLEDGSRVTLGGETELRVTFTDRSRHLELVHGEASFVVARETERPFTVDAGGATVRAVGTLFNVRRSRDRVVVSVVEGRVVVEPAAQPQKGGVLREPVQLDVGQQTTVDSEGAVQSVSQLMNPETAIAWHSGRLTFRGESLHHVLEAVNRYTTRPVVLGDAALGELKFTGTVLNDNIPGWIASLENVFGLRAIQEGGRIVLWAGDDPVPSP